MVIKTRGIVFRTFKYAETSVICDIYTEIGGLKKYIIKGVRKKKARINPSLLQVMSLVEIVAYDRTDRDLNLLKEIRPAYIFQTVPFDVKRGAIGLFMAEIARKTIKESEPNDRLFDFLFESFRYLDQTPNPIGNLHLTYLLSLTSFLGFVPSGGFDASTPYFDAKEGYFVSTIPAHIHYLDEVKSKALSDLLNRSMPDCHQVGLNRQLRRALLRSILDFYRLHIENLPEINAHLILQEVLDP